jgi:hypothetical protein
LREGNAQKDLSFFETVSWALKVNYYNVDLQENMKGPENGILNFERNLLHGFWNGK